MNNMIVIGGKIRCTSEEVVVHPWRIRCPGETDADYLLVRTDRISGVVPFRIGSIIIPIIVFDTHRVSNNSLLIDGMHERIISPANYEIFSRIFSMAKEADALVLSYDVELYTDIYDGYLKNTSVFYVLTSEAAWYTASRLPVIAPIDMTTGTPITTSSAYPVTCLLLSKKYRGVDASVYLAGCRGRLFRDYSAVYTIINQSSINSVLAWHES